MKFKGVRMSSRYQKFFQEIKEGRTAILDSGVSTELERQGAPMQDTHWSGRVSIVDFDILRLWIYSLTSFIFQGT